MTQPTKAFLAGAVARGIVLGLLLSIALWQLAMIATSARLFRYQGF